MVSNVETVRSIYEAFDTNDIDRLASFGVPDAKVTNVAFGKTSSLRDYAANWANAFPDGKIEIRRLIDGGDYVIAEIVGRGTHTGKLESPGGIVPPTGKRAELQMVEIIQFSPEGKLLGSRVYFDCMALLEQLGLLQPVTLPPQVAAPQPELRH